MTGKKTDMINRCRNLVRITEKQPEIRNNVPGRCSECLYYQPLFRYRSCLFSNCIYHRDCRIFRLEPLHREYILERKDETKGEDSHR